MDACNRSLALNDRKWTRREIGKTLIELKKCDQAITFLKESLQKWNNDLLLNLCLAEAYRCNEDYVDAISRYKKCLRIDPENFWGHLQIAQCYYAQREWDKAEEWFKKSIKLDPKCFASLHNLGLVYVNKGEFSKALKSFKNALKLAPENADTKEMINACQLEIERRRLPEKLEELSGTEGVVGSLARLMLYIEQYAKADDLLIAGRNETKPEYKSGVFIRNKVSPKIYQAQGLFEKIKHDLEKIEVSDAHIQEVVELFLVSADQRVAGIETFSRGYYTWVKDYKGEYEKGEAKIRLADSYFLNGLKKLQVQLKKHKAQFGVAAQDILVHLINYLEKVNEI